MTQWGWAVGLVLWGCSYDATYFDTPAEQLRADAAAQWATVGVQAPRDYVLTLLDPADLTKACGVSSDTPTGGCSLPGVVILSDAEDYPEQLRRLTHELGHLMRGPGKRGELDRRHLDCPESARHEPGTDVMCATGAALGAPPTARDAAFVSAVRHHAPAR